MKESKYFTLQELLHSDTAINSKIENIPSWNEVEKLNNLAVNYLDVIRENWGEPLIISSGYRCPKLNSKVGGVYNSAHMTGDAVDIQSKDLSKQGAEKLFDFIKDLFSKKNIKIDQCFIEHSKSDHWVHLSIAPKLRNKYGEINV